MPLSSAYAEVALLLVNDEEWRVGPLQHASTFAGWDACLCFEAGQTGADGVDEVIVKRKAAATVHVTAAGRSSHSGSAPHRWVTSTARSTVRPACVPYGWPSTSA